MNVKIFASGSKANCYAVCDGTTTILLECGLPYRKTLAALDYKLPDAILITHEHIDHARSVRRFLNLGVDCYMTAGTARALKLDRHNLHVVSANRYVDVHGVPVLPIKSTHDASEPVNFIVNNEILLVTDTGEVPLVAGHFKTVLVEANYELSLLRSAQIDEVHRERIIKNHLSIVQAKQLLRAIEEPDETYLIHVSKRNGDAADFVKQVKLATGFRNVFAAEVTR